VNVNLPKPLHGWRAFSGEVGVIVLGVLIALAAQQVVQDIQDRNDVRQLVAALRAELSDDRARWEHIRASDVCTLQRLDAIEQWVATAPAGERLKKAYILYLWNMHSSVWDLARTSPATSKIPLGERLTYATLYGAIENWRDFINEENVNAIVLASLLATADEPENRRQIRFHLVQARSFVTRRQVNYDYFFTRFDALRIKPDESQLTVHSNDRRLCEPLERAG
jgi:hypothetical protein